MDNDGNGGRTPPRKGCGGDWRLFSLHCVPCLLLSVFASSGGDLYRGPFMKVARFDVVKAVTSIRATIRAGSARMAAR
jgi:hypothetical protein